MRRSRFARVSTKLARQALAALAPLLLVSAMTTATGVARGAASEGAEQCRHGKLRLAADESSKALDDETGRNLRNFPPDRVVDYLHMKLEMRFDDLGAMRFSAVEHLRIAPIWADAESITLNAVGLDVSSVSVGSRPVEHFADGETLTLRFDPPLARGRECEIRFEYVCDHPSRGMTFTPASAERSEYTAEVHTQGQETGNRHWFIAHDQPNERMTTELIVDVPAEFAVSSNGRLVSTFVNGDRATWHWLQDKPHVSYLVSLVIGRFDIVEIPHDRVPMKVWVPVGLGDQVMQTYGRTGEMIDVFERRFGLPYPWDRYDQLVLKNFAAGGMENTSATSMYPTAIFDEIALLDGDLDGLIAHELAHQWSGDLLTCKEWAHIWLNEGFATYGESLWYEYRDGQDGYLDDMRRNFRVARRDRTTDEIAMVSPIYEDAWEVFGRPGNPYPKGASILHMLRMMLGEDVFWRGMHLYMSRHALGTVETGDFRYALEEVSGRGLEWFFDQWCFRPGSPNLDVKIAYDAKSRELLVDIEQTQHIDARTPAFRFTLPIHVRTAGGQRKLAIEVAEKETAYRAVLDGVPELVAVDPELHVLSVIEVDKAEAFWVRQVEDGPTIVARHRAIAEIGESDTPDHRALLASIVRDESAHVTLRNRALEALAGFGSEEARSEVLAIQAGGVEEAKVRVNLVRALADFEAAQVVDALAETAASDASYATRAAAIDGLAKLEAKEHADLIVELVGYESQHDQVRRSALRALADLDDPRGLDLAIEYAAYGYVDRSRPTAIGAIGKLAGHDTDRAVDVLIDLLDDPARRPAGAAGRALAEIGDERAERPLQAMAETHPNERTRRSAERWLETLRKNMSEGDGGSDTRRRRGERRREARMSDDDRPDDGVLRLERVFDAPPERVFAAWTSAADLERWVWGSIGKDVTAEVDLRVGGRYQTSTARPDGEPWAMSGVYLEVEPSRRLAYTVEWSAPMGYESPGERVTVEFIADGAGTKMTFAHEGVPLAKARATHEQGWQNTFDALDGVLAAGS